MILKFCVIAFMAISAPIGIEEQLLELELPAVRGASFVRDTEDLGELAVAALRGEKIRQLKQKFFPSSVSQAQALTVHAGREGSGRAQLPVRWCS